LASSGEAGLRARESHPWQGGRLEVLSAESRRWRSKMIITQGNDEPEGSYEDLLNSLSPQAAARAYTKMAPAWQVHPLWWPTPRGCACGDLECEKSNGKHPILRDFLDVATNDLHVIDRWFRQWPDANLGLVTGKRSGCWVLDVDPRHGGDQSLADLVQQHGPLPRQLTVRSGGHPDGLHRYFSLDAENSVGNGRGSLPPGLDVRGNGGQVVLPPSMHQSGARYQWEVLGPIPPAPPWLLDLIRTPPSRGRPAAPPGQPSRSLAGLPGATPADTPYGRAALADEAAAVSHTPEGTRNDALNTGAFRMGQLVAAGHLSKTVTAHLAAAGEETVPASMPWAGRCRPRPTRRGVRPRAAYLCCADGQVSARQSAYVAAVRPA